MLKNSRFIIGNSSSGIREAPAYAVPTINVGSRQHNRFYYESIFNVKEEQKLILETIKNVLDKKKKFKPSDFFGHKQSSELFLNVLENQQIWQISTQKQFVDAINEIDV